MEPNIWGPHAWFFLHSVSLMYPEHPSEQDKHNYFNFFIQLKNVLPCIICRQNYNNHLIKYPLKKSLNSREDLARWLVNIHNEVNKIHKKKQYTYEEVLQMYKDIYNEKIRYKVNNYTKIPDQCDECKKNNFKNDKLNKLINNLNKNISNLKLVIITISIVLVIVFIISFCKFKYNKK